MITPDKLWQLEGGQRRRKLALTFGALERDIAGIAEPGNEYSFGSMARAEYTRKLAAVVMKDPLLPENARAELQALLDSPVFDERRLCNCARNHLLAIIGTFPAEWDLVIAPHSQTETAGQVENRPFFKGVKVYAEDIRSPFNLGSIMRTAEAFGAEQLYLSPFCTDEKHPRAIRSAMGCNEVLSVSRISLDQIPEEENVFVLETGGTDIRDFKFPKTGVVILGSEELGVSPEALARANCGCVSIPMYGMKASLNVGVAFGILMENWIASLTR